MLEWAWYLACYAGLTLMSRTAVGFYNAKPILKQSVLDRYEKDLVLSYWLSGGFLIPLRALESEGLRLPRPLSEAAAWTFQLLNQVSFLYVSLTAVARFCHVRYRTVDFFGDVLGITEADAVWIFRTVAVAASAGVCAALFLLGARPAFYSVATGNDDDGGWASTFARVSLAGAGILTNVMLRIVLWRERRKTAPEAGGSVVPTSALSVRLKSNFSLAQLCLLGLTFLAVSLMAAAVESPWLRQRFSVQVPASFVACVCVPAVLVAANPDMRRHAAKKAAAACGFNNRVKPELT